MAANTTNGRGTMVSDPDDGLDERIAASLRAGRRAELERVAHPRHPVPQPEWLFGPHHRVLDAERAAEAERVRLARGEPEPVAAQVVDEERFCPRCGRVMIGDAP